MAFDLTITLGNVIEICTITIGAIVLVVRHSATLEWMKKELDNIQAEVKQISKIISNQALIDIRLTRLEKEVDELGKRRFY